MNNYNRNYNQSQGNNYQQPYSGQYNNPNYQQPYQQPYYQQGSYPQYPQGYQQQPYYSQPQQPGYRDGYIRKRNQTNGWGIAGFICSLVALFCFWIPLFNWVIWIAGFMLSFIGMFQKPSGIAIAGVVIEIIALFPLAFLTSFFASLMG